MLLWPSLPLLSLQLLNNLGTAFQRGLQKADQGGEGCGRPTPSASITSFKTRGNQLRSSSVGVAYGELLGLVVKDVLTSGCAMTETFLEFPTTSVHQSKLGP